MFSSLRKPAAVAEVSIRKARKSTYTEPLRDKSKEYSSEELEDLKSYLADFYRTIYKRREECSKICQDNPKTVGYFFDILVPRHVTFEDFWQRYFFRCDPERVLKEWDIQATEQKNQFDQKVHDSVQSAQKLWTSTLRGVKRNTVERRGSSDSHDRAIEPVGSDQSCADSLASARDVSKCVLGTASDETSCIKPSLKLSVETDEASPDSLPTCSLDTPAMSSVASPDGYEVTYTEYNASLGIAEGSDLMESTSQPQEQEELFLVDNAQSNQPQTEIDGDKMSHSKDDDELGAASLPASAETCGSTTLVITCIETTTLPAIEDESNGKIIDVSDATVEKSNRRDESKDLDMKLSVGSTSESYAETGARTVINSSIASGTGNSKITTGEGGKAVELFTFQHEVDSLAVRDACEEEVSAQGQHSKLIATERDLLFANITPASNQLDHELNSSLNNQSDVEKADPVVEPDESMTCNSDTNLQSAFAADNHSSADPTPTPFLCESKAAKTCEASADKVHSALCDTNNFPDTSKDVEVEMAAACNDSTTDHAASCLQVVTELYQDQLMEITMLDATDLTMDASSLHPTTVSKGPTDAFSGPLVPEKSFEPQDTSSSAVVPHSDPVLPELDAIQVGEVDKTSRDFEVSTRVENQKKAETVASPVLNSRSKRLQEIQRKTQRTTTPTNARKELEALRESPGGSSIKNLRAFWDQHDKLPSSPKTPKILASPDSFVKRTMSITKSEGVDPLKSAIEDQIKLDPSNDQTNSPNNVPSTMPKKETTSDSVTESAQECVIMKPDEGTTDAQPPVAEPLGASLMPTEPFTQHNPTPSDLQPKQSKHAQGTALANTLVEHGKGVEDEVVSKTKEIQPFEELPVLVVKNFATTPSGVAVEPIVAPPTPGEHLSSPSEEIEDSPRTDFEVTQESTATKTDVTGKVIAKPQSNEKRLTLKEETLILDCLGTASSDASHAPTVSQDMKAPLLQEEAFVSVPDVGESFDLLNTQTEVKPQTEKSSLVDEAAFIPEPCSSGDPEGSAAATSKGVRKPSVDSIEEPKKLSDMGIRVVEATKTKSSKGPHLSFIEVITSFLIILLAVGAPVAVWSNQDYLCAPAMGDVTLGRSEAPFWAPMEYKAILFDLFCGYRSKTSLEWSSAPRGLHQLVVEVDQSFLMKRERLISVTVTPKQIIMTNKKGKVEQINAPWTKTTTK